MQPVSAYFPALIMHVAAFPPSGLRHCRARPKPLKSISGAPESGHFATAAFSATTLQCALPPHPPP